MGIISGNEIKAQVKSRGITIDPYNESLVGPNSVDLRLGPILKRVNDREFDLTKSVSSDVTIIEIPEEGFILEKGVGYLGCTVERTHTDKFVPWIDGRSTVGRYFLQVHVTAGRGDVGFDDQWTLELIALYRPVRVYAYIPICQVSFFTLEGARPTLYEGRYQRVNRGPVLPKPLSIKPLQG